MLGPSIGVKQASSCKEYFALVSCTCGQLWLVI